ncbi:cupin domain-containing protein [Prochlorococcus marinus]|uniref:cupin domain-containing protein n=1 Tax=Prochlorococcus marinus TaxID=1219 RepID=UPI0022B38B4C|nr:cupin domain-containing protein [Prochlorococcus marinus]
MDSYLKRTNLKIKNSLINIFNPLFLSAITLTSVFIILEPAKSQEKLEVSSLIQSSRRLSGENISYPRLKQAVLRLLKVNIPIGLKTPLHIHPAQMLVYKQQGKLKYLSGETINILALENDLLKQ